MRRLAVFLLILLRFCTLAAASADAYVIPLSSPLYGAMDALYAITGNGTPSTSRPWTAAEAEIILSRISRTGLSDKELSFRETVESMLEEEKPVWMLDEGTFGLSTTLSVNPEYYLHSNTSYDNDTDWIWNYEYRRPFADLTLEMSAFSWFYTTANAQYTKGRWDGRNDGLWYYEPDTDYPDGIGAGILPDDKTSHIPAGSISWRDIHNTNFPLLPETFEFDWPKRALISFAGSYWSLTIGRDRMNWGDAAIGNLLIDDGLEYHDALRFKVYTENIFEYEVLFSFFDDDWSGEFHESERFKMLMAHRIAFRPSSWISFSLSENVMYRSGVLEGQNLNPAFIFHNLNNREMFNAIAWGEISLMPFKGLEIYGQFVIDQGRLPQESNSEQDAWGISAGVDYTALAGNGYIEAGIEAAYTTPLLYRRDKVDFIVPHRTSTQLADGNTLKLFYVGFPHGGDTIAAQIGISYTQPGLWSLSSSFKAVVHGSVDMFRSHNKDGNNDGYPNLDVTTPSGDDVSCALTWTVSGEWNIVSIPSIFDAGICYSISLIDTFMIRGDSDPAEAAGMDVQFILAANLTFF